MRWDLKIKGTKEDPSELSEEQEEKIWKTSLRESTLELITA